MALTFDVGSDAGGIPPILTTLRDERVRATFSITGRWAEQQPALIRAIAADGHQIINGGYSGTPFATLTFEQRALELSRGETSIYRATNRSTRPYARPAGDVDASVVRDLGALGYGVIVLGLVDGKNDMAAVLSRAAPGAIVRLSTRADSAYLDALALAIDSLREDGFMFETVAEMVAENRTAAASPSSGEGR